LTAEQNAQSSENYQPVAFTNLFWSDDRFVYGVSPVKDNVESTVVKLNALGKNVFAQSIDFYSIAETSKKSNMQLVDMTVDDEGVFTVLDQTTGRLFQYDEYCNLLGIFGGYGNQKGLFLSPVSLEADSENNLLVLDAKKLTVTVMTQTLYGEKIREANNLYNDGRYIESVKFWEEVLLMNPNFIRAYVGMGKACLAMDHAQSMEMFNVGKYEQAMDFFMMGKDQDGYAEAKAGLRDEIVRTNFGLVAAIVILAMISILGYDQIKAMFRKIAWKISTRKGD
jgi:tetratricopeptide (TPR) repeat protein